MRASDFEGKEVIEISTGERLGVIKESELLINLKTGKVEALVLLKHGWGGNKKEVRSIPWSQIRKISDDLIIFDLQPTEP